MYTTKTIKTKDGLQLFKHSWKVDQPKAKLIFLHGFTEHGLRYEHLAKRVNASNISLVAFDLRGHGRSEGLRAHVENFNVYLDDLQVMIEEEQTASLPTFLSGHSLGALISLSYTIERNIENINGIIAIGSAVQMPKEYTPLIQKVVFTLAKLFPKLPTIPLDVTYGINDTQEMEIYFNDPLVYRGRIKIGFVAQLIKALKKIQRQLTQLHAPCLLMHGAADKMASPEGVKLLYEQAASNDKTLKLWDGLYHSILHEPEKEEVMQAIVDWVLERA